VTKPRKISIILSQTNVLHLIRKFLIDKFELVR